MGRGSQQAHGKMLNITNHQGNANQNQMRYHLIPIRMAIIKRQQISSVGKDVEKREPLFTVGRNINWGTIMENSMQAPHKIKIKNRTTI